VGTHKESVFGIQEMAGNLAANEELTTHGHFLLMNRTQCIKRPAVLMVITG
jgi:hypothetical protein